MSYSVGGRRGSDPMLLWLWWRPAAVAPIRPLAWELLYVAGVALKKKKKKGITLKIKVEWNNLCFPVITLTYPNLERAVKASFIF